MTIEIENFSRKLKGKVGGSAERIQEKLIRWRELIKWSGAVEKLGHEIILCGYYYYLDKIIWVKMKLFFLFKQIVHTPVILSVKQKRQKQK
jgi:hypothetical protein